MLIRLSRAVPPGLILAAVLWAARMPAAQQLAQTPPAPPNSVATFRTEINYVEVSARVVDAQGNFVRNLRKQDFQVFEDKKAQTIAAFDLIDIPVERAEKPVFAAAPIEPDVVTNVRGFDGRLYVLALDSLHTSPLRSQLVRAAARKFIEENLGANDLAAVIDIGRTDLSQELTGNRRLLLAAVDKFVGQKPASPAAQQVDANNLGVVNGVSSPGGDLAAPDEGERVLNARRSFDTLARLADWMGRVRGRRKALVYLSEGLDYDITAPYDNPDRSPNSIRTNSSALLLGETQDVISAATRNDVNIYAVDPRGLTAGGDESIGLAMLAVNAPADAAPDPSTGIGSAPTFRPDYGLTSLKDELRVAQDSLRTLSDETGGFAALNSNDFSSAFRRIVEDSSAYYMLGYYSTNEKRDGKYRNINVRINGRPGLAVRARKGYLAPRGKATPATTDDGLNVSGRIGDLITSLVPVSGVTFGATAASFRAAPARNAVIVTVEASGKDLMLTAKDGRYTGKLEVLLAAYDRDNKLQASKRSAVDLGFRPETYNLLTQRAGSFRLVSQLELPPGQYHLQAALVDPASKKGGSVQYELEVPDFSKPPLAMSGLVVSSAKASFWPTVADKGLAVTLAVAPTTLREFAADDALAAFVQVYNNQPTPIHTIDITSTVRANDGHIVFNGQEAHSSDESPDSRGKYDYSVRIPLRGLSPGLYVLTLEARSRLGNGEPISRVVQFRVR
jgi:VWFA-related protein